MVLVTPIGLAAGKLRALDRTKNAQNDYWPNSMLDFVDFWEKAARYCYKKTGRTSHPAGLRVFLWKPKGHQPFNFFTMSM